MEILIYGHILDLLAKVIDNAYKILIRYLLDTY